jgi:hypothetical protein
MTMKLTSPAFKRDEQIPVKYTGDGDDVSPPLAWSDPPGGTQEFALICDDPDAPTPSPWVHWVIYRIPADFKGLPEGIPNQEYLEHPPGALQGKNSFADGATIGYRGPAPPPGHGVHHYHFKLYALESKLHVQAGADKKTLLEEISGIVLEEAKLTGTYQR